MFVILDRNVRQAEMQSQQQQHHHATTNITFSCPIKLISFTVNRELMRVAEGLRVDNEISLNSGRSLIVSINFCGECRVIN